MNRNKAIVHSLNEIGIGADDRDEGLRIGNINQRFAILFKIVSCIVSHQNKMTGTWVDRLGRECGKVFGIAARILSMASIVIVWPFLSLNKYTLRKATTKMKPQKGGEAHFILFIVLHVHETAWLNRSFEG